MKTSHAAPENQSMAESRKFQNVGPVHEPAQLQANHTGMPDNLKAGIENLSGYSMADVKVHYNSAKPMQLQAHAYAQGSHIHVAPGRERHLPHEAWHVVQQKQGRVKANKQFRGKTPVNDDAGLEHEADVMGSRALSMPVQAKTLSHVQAPGHTAQAFSVMREPKLGSLYSVSDDKTMVTGMNTPNHDLYVDRPSKMDEMEKAVKNGMLSFRAGATQQLFAKNYKKVHVGFKKVSIKEKVPKWYDKDNVDTHQLDMTATYHKHVQKAVEEQSIGKYKKVLEVIKQAPWAKHFDNMHSLLGPLTKQLELLKKLILINQSGDYHPLMNNMEDAEGVIAALEGVLYSKTATRDSFAEITQGLTRAALKLRGGLGGDTALVDTLDEVMLRYEQFVKVFPADHEVNMILLHSANYQLGMLASIRDNDPMFYRACDVMASTVMGNQVTHDNMDQLKIYSSEGGNAFHYAAKVLKSGNDWVSLESFAAGERERDILGITKENASKNLDNSWQYMMYGSAKKGSQSDGEDNYFEIYTQLRYYLKGIKAGGLFRTDQRERITSPIGEDDLAPALGGSVAKSREIFQRLTYNGVLLDGEVRSPRYLEEDYIRIRLKKDDQPQAKVISDRLKLLYRTPRSTRSHVQAAGNDEIKNISAWIDLLKLPVDGQKLATEHGDRIFGEGPAKAHGKAWKELMLALVHDKKAEK